MALYHYELQSDKFNAKHIGSIQLNEELASVDVDKLRSEIVKSAIDFMKESSIVTTSKDWTLTKLTKEKNNGQLT